MKAKAVKKIGDRISKKFGVFYGEGIISERVKLASGLRCIEVRTELVSYEGGNEFLQKVKEKLGYEGENLGGCIYRFYNESEA